LSAKSKEKRSFSVFAVYATILSLDTGVLLELLHSHCDVGFVLLLLL
jgi:hypothetical protein